MDTLSITIIVTSVVLAVAFKWVLFRKIQRWMDQDLIKQLAAGQLELETLLTHHYEELRRQGMKRRHIHEKLQTLAHKHEPRA